MEHSSHELFEMHAIVKGNVQGVGFRALTRYHAMDLGLKGTVKNLHDGTVEIYAQGSRRRLEDLIQKLKSELPMEEASLEFFPIENPHQDFRIVH
jgi:acylphosphatase